MRISLKTCRKCSLPKSYSSFCNNKAEKDGKNRQCRDCAKEQTKLARTNHPERVKAQSKRYQKKHPNVVKSGRLKYRYGIDLVEYNRMFVSQNGCCKICGVHQSELKKSLSVDHCHTTSKVRGLLCYKCNHILGLAKDDTNILKAAINYLTQIS